VIGVCAPWSAAVSAQQIGQRLQIPYIIEFQDPWREFFENGSFRLHLKFLRSVTAQAASLISVCRHWCDQDAEELGRPSLCVPNGFEPSLVPDQRASNTPDLNLAYLGSVGYIGHESIDIAWRGLSQTTDIPWTLSYAGADHKLMKEGAARWHLDNRVKVNASLSQSAGLDMLARADALLLFTHPTRDSHLGSKFAEYVALRRPVVLIGRRDPFVEAAAARVTRLLVCENSHSLERTVRALAVEKSRVGYVASDGSEQDIQQLSWPTIAATFLSQLHDIT
jgi:hypothetical protein